MTAASGYDAHQIRVAPWPRPEDAGNGWWRFAWRVGYDASATTEIPPLPAPWNSPVDSDHPATLHTLIGVVTAGPGQVRLEVLSRYKGLHPDEIGYLVNVVATLQESLGPLTIDGFPDHPFVRWGRRTVPTPRESDSRL